MKLLSWLTGWRADLPEAPTNRDPSSDFWYMPVGRRTAAGIPVTVERALTVPVVWDCLKVLMESVSQLPFAIFRRADDGSKVRVDNHPLMAVLQEPNEESTAPEFFAQLMFDLATDGNFFAEPVEGRLGAISELWRLEPQLVRVERLEDRSKRFKYAAPGRTGERTLLADEVWHLRAPPHAHDGLRGVSPIHAGREAIAAAIALQDYAARFFDNDATPPFFLINKEASFEDDISRINFLAAIRRWWGGDRRHTPGVLDNDWEPKELSIDNQKSQFLETRSALGVELTRIWRVPPHKVGILDKATFSNIEQQSLEFVTDTLLPWLGLIEKSIKKHLIIGPQYYFEFNVAGLLRGDLKARYEAYTHGRQWGWLSINDIRRLENMNPIPAGGDQYLVPLNMAPAGSPAALAPSSPPGDQEKRVFGPSGEVVSRIINGNVIRLEDYRNAA